MVERLVSIVPSHLPSYLAISGGCDSRFVLGILFQAGIRPELIRLSDTEDLVAQHVAEQLGLRLTVVTEPAADPGPRTYTVMTDAQIYFRGGHYGRLRNHLEPGATYYSGLFADSLVKNAFRAAWKVPRRRRDMLERLIEHALLSRMRAREPGLSSAAVKAHLRRFLRERLAVSDADGPFERPKEQAAWFYFVHRGIVWTPANLADLSFYTEPVLPLADVKALALGIRSSAWSNFHNDRVRGLSRRLLPQVTAGYTNNQRVSVSRWPRRGWEKIAYEYGSRAIEYLKGKAQGRGPRSASEPRRSGNDVESSGFRSYFDRPFPDVLSSADCSDSTKRAAITVNSALAYLESSASAWAGVGAEPATGTDAALERGGVRP
jgi:hypothetical protein